MHSTIMDPTVGTFAGFIVEPIDVVTMADIMGADITDLIIAPTITGLIVGMCVECKKENIQCNGCRPAVGERWSSRLVATATQDCLN